MASTSEERVEITFTEAFFSIREIIEQFRKGHDDKEAINLCEDVKSMIDDYEEYIAE